jgi:hypothetical protein
MEVTLSAGGRTVRLLGTARDDGAPCLIVSPKSLKGWYSTPAEKGSDTARSMGDGDFPREEGTLLYESRVVTIYATAIGRTRDEVIAQADLLRALLHHEVTCVVDDGAARRMATGSITVDLEESDGFDVALGATISMTCRNPREYGLTPRRAYLSPGASAGALVWHGGAPHGLVWPLSYGGGGAGANVATLRNDGTATAYPTITASGDMDGLTITDVATGAQLAWDGHVGAQPVTLDCLARAASVAGVDASRLLSARGFPSVPPGGEVTLALAAEGTGTVEVAWRDTYV